MLPSEVDIARANLGANIKVYLKCQQEPFQV